MFKDFIFLAQSETLVFELATSTLPIATSLTTLSANFKLFFSMYNTEVLSQDHLSPSVPTVELCSLLSEIISISEIKSVSVKIPDNFAS